MRSFPLVMLILLSSLLLACGDDGRRVPLPDGSADASSDAGGDGGAPDATIPDAGPDSAVADGSMDATADADADASGDDASADAVADASGDADADTSGDADADACTMDVTFYADCDGDRYPPSGAETTMACAAPTTPPSSCPSGATAATWTTVSSWVDCNDENDGVSPGVSGYRDTPIPGAPAAVDFDYNCDGTEEQRWTALGGCVPSGADSGSACTLTEGWQTSVPDCGVSGFYIDSCAMSPGPGGVWECNARGSTIAAPCR